MFGMMLDFILEPLGAFTRLFFHKIMGKRVSYIDLISDSDRAITDIKSYYNVCLGLIMFVLIIYSVIKVYSIIYY